MSEPTQQAAEGSSSDSQLQEQNPSNSTDLDAEKGNIPAPVVTQESFGQKLRRRLSRRRTDYEPPPDNILKNRKPLYSKTSTTPNYLQRKRIHGGIHV
jgi:hypothetical protein